MKRLMLVGVLSVALMLAMTVPALAKSREAQGKMVLNITYKTINHPDSGLSGWWSLNELNRHVQVWQTGETSYRAIVSDQGKWNTFEGITSPGDQAATQGADASGTLHGGYVVLFESEGLVEGAKNGNLGIFDYHGDLTGGGPGPVTPFDWGTEYFGVSVYDMEMPTWGWTYKYQNQKWVNSSEGNSGDIVIP